MKLKELLEHSSTIYVVDDVDDTDDFYLAIDPTDCNYEYCLTEKLLEEEVDFIFAEKDKLYVCLEG